MDGAGMTSAESRRSDQLVELSTKAFERHIIRQRSEGRWILQRRYEDGNGWDGAYWAEVISLFGGELYVGGDIDFVIFGRYSDSTNHEAKLRWMGRCTDFGYYVAQKARIGTGAPLVDVYDADVAKETVRGWLEDETESAARYDGDTAYAEKLRAIVDADEWSRPPWDDQHALLEHLRDELGSNFMTERYDLGMVLAPRVLLLHASATMRIADYEAACDFMRVRGLGRLKTDTIGYRPAIPVIPPRIQGVGDDWLPRGVIVGKCRVVGHIGPMGEDGQPGFIDVPGLAPGEWPLNPARPLNNLLWWTDGYGLALDDVQPSTNLVPCRGALGLWTVPDDVLAKVRWAA